jgi:hypothetical protein
MEPDILSNEDLSLLVAKTHQALLRGGSLLSWFSGIGYDQKSFDEIIAVINPASIFVINAVDNVYTCRHFGLDPRNPVEFKVPEVELLGHVRDGDVLEFLGLLAIQEHIAG